MPDAVATTAGAAFGTSTVTCYIESSTGIAEGGRTGLTSVVTACLFLSALFFAPLVRMIGGGYVVGGTTFYPITAPVLIIVGCLMARNLVHINWRQWDEALPSYLIVVGMPLTFSIADGMALGFISYPLIKLFCGKAREVHWCIYLVAILFVFRYSVS
jgi:AGZA family xanthine/uracil permease-like MFS transporter